MHDLSRAKHLVYVFMGALLAFMPLLTSSDYMLHTMIMMGIAIMLATSNRLILVTGAWFMGQAAFYALGAYGLVLLRSKLGLNFWVAFPIAGLISGSVALGLGYATQRVKGMYFALISVAFVEVVRLTIVKTAYLGGPNAVMCSPPEPFLGIDFSTKAHYYYFVLLVVGFSVALLALIERWPFGAILRTMAENESLAESIGINTVRYRVVIMSVCTFIGGIAGAFYAPYVGVTGPTSFTLNTSVMILFYVVVGGMGSIWGPVIGAVVLTILPEILPNKASYQNIFYAAIVLGSLFFLPEGLINLPNLVLRKMGFMTDEHMLGETK